jgi:hypothetical protein
MLPLSGVDRDDSQLTRFSQVNAYALAQLLPQTRGRREGAPGSLLVLVGLERPSRQWNIS